MLRDADGGLDNQNGGMQVDDEEDGAGEKDEMAEKEAVYNPERDRPPSPPVVPGTNAASEQGGGGHAQGGGAGEAGREEAEASEAQVAVKQVVVKQEGKPAARAAVDSAASSGIAASTPAPKPAGTLSSCGLMHLKQQQALAHSCKHACAKASRYLKQVPKGSKVPTLLP